MTAEHFCEIHNVKFYENRGKDGKPNWWSHKVATGGYCNEKKKQVAVKPSTDLGNGQTVGEVFPDALPAKKTEPKDSYRSPINRSVALRYSVDLVIGGKLDIKEVLACADKFLQYIEKGD